MNANCHVELIQKDVSVEDQNAAQMVILAVWGLGCENCANRVRNSLLRLDGVVSADIALAHGLAMVDYVPSKTNSNDILLAVAAAGNDGHHHYRAEIVQ
ncbi:heavy-metal-associated domain-containing protein [Anaerolineae bacterium CFX7]|nr:heavy-metal-associated domain-containing protein [Anaerolineae bacterium CFX7]